MDPAMKTRSKVQSTVRRVYVCPSCYRYSTITMNYGRARGPRCEHCELLLLSARLFRRRVPRAERLRRRRAAAAARSAAAALALGDDATWSSCGSALAGSDDAAGAGIDRYTPLPAGPQVGEYPSR